MSDKKLKNYIKGSAREAAFSRGRGDIINIDLFVPDLDEIANEKGFAKITVYRRREIDDYGNTHYMFENTFVPDKSKSHEPLQADDKDPVLKEGKDEMPWD